MLNFPTFFDIPYFHHLLLRRPPLHNFLLNYLNFPYDYYYYYLFIYLYFHPHYFRLHPNLLFFLLLLPLLLILLVNFIIAFQIIQWIKPIYLFLLRIFLLPIHHFQNLYYFYHHSDYHNHHFKRNYLICYHLHS
jgi:hypothetical protein